MTHDPANPSDEDLGKIADAAFLKHIGRARKVPSPSWKLLMARDAAERRALYLAGRSSRDQEVARLKKALKYCAAVAGGWEGDELYNQDFNKIKEIASMNLADTGGE